ncbi:MerR HTH family regulatory protein [Sphingomonas sp. NFR04]|uniref:MerR family transcriptional regulator n=1 Tax=Sphingomonas sp. NFR04 TaxID=1566283 RepID=UPI0008ED9A57|nr:MerR family transcriptional regulator [Sphingomonas sp. NFR04]SFK44057.1 MerR HTH family regulatory protein [Sphingomonas sp. NFR04]
MVSTQDDKFPMSVKVLSAFTKVRYTFTGKPMILDSFTRAQVSELTGLSNDVLAHWTKEGILRPADRSTGTGKHKFFRRREVNKVAILSKLREFHCSISTIRWLSERIDQAYAIHDACGGMDPYQLYSAPSITSYLKRFRSGLPTRRRYRFYDSDSDSIIYAKSEEEIINREDTELSEQEYDIFKRIIFERLDDDDAEIVLQIAADLSETAISHQSIRNIWLLWPESGGWKLFSDTDENLSGLRLSPPAAIYLHVTRVVRAVWGMKYTSSWGEEDQNG